MLVMYGETPMTSSLVLNFSSFSSHFESVRKKKEERRKVTNRASRHAQSG